MWSKLQCKIENNFNMEQHMYWPSLSKSTWGVQPVEDISNFTCIFVYLFMYSFLSRLLAKRKTIQTWYLAHILALTSSKNVFFVLSKKFSWRPLASKNCRVTWIFRISPRLPFYFLFLLFWGHTPWPNKKTKQTWSLVQKLP